MDKSIRLSFAFLLSILLLAGSVFATSPDPADTVAYYKFDENTGTTAGDATPNANDGTITGATWTTEANAKIGHSSIEFSGTANHQVNTGFTSVDTSQPFTYNGWFNIDTTSGIHRSIMQNIDSTTTWAPFVQIVSGKPQAGYRVSGTVYSIEATTTFTTGTWYMITYIYDGTSIKLYVNGVQEAILTSAVIPPNDVTNNLFIGAWKASGGGFYDGRIDEVSIFNKALTADEIAYLYASGTPGEAQQYPYPQGSPFFEVRSQEYNSTQLTHFNVTMEFSNSSSYTYEATTGNYTTPFNTTDKVNITITSFMDDAYINQYFENYNITNTPLVFNYSILDITAKDGITNASISNFTITFRGNETISNASKVRLFTDPALYQLNASSTGYANTAFNRTTTNNISSYSVSLFGANSVFVNIFDAADNTKITQSSTVFFEGTNQTYQNTTTTGELYFTNLTSGQYTVTISSAGYQNGIYEVNVGSGTFQYLNAYLVNESDTNVVFLFQDLNTGTILEGVSFNVERFINGSYVLTNSLTSDISGRVQTGYVVGSRYRYTATFDTYQTKTFILDPVIFSSYTVRLEREQEDIAPMIGITFTPQLFFNNQAHNFSITVSSPTGDLLYYQYTIQVTNNETLITGNGNNAYGETMTNLVTIANALTTDRVIVSVNITRSDGSSYLTQRVFVIANSNTNTFSFLDNAENPFGLSLFDRIIILVVTTLIASGLAFWFGGFAGSSVIALLILGYFGAIGIVPMWAVWVSVTMGSILFIWGTSQ